MSGTLTFVAIIVGIIALSVVAVAVVTIARWPQIGGSVDDPLLTKTLVVHTKDEQTVRGVLLANHDDRMTLTQAIYIGPQGETSLTGLIHIRHANIRFMQEISADTDNPERRLKAVNEP